MLQMLRHRWQRVVAVLVWAAAVVGLSSLAVWWCVRAFGPGVVIAAILIGPLLAETRKHHRIQPRPARQSPKRARAPRLSRRAKVIVAMAAAAVILSCLVVWCVSVFGFGVAVGTIGMLLLEFRKEQKQHQKQQQDMTLPLYVLARTIVFDSLVLIAYFVVWAIPVIGLSWCLVALLFWEQHVQSQKQHCSDDPNPVGTLAPQLKSPVVSPAPSVPSYWSCAKADTRSRAGGFVNVTDEAPWQQRFKRLFGASRGHDGSVRLQLRTVWRCEQPRLYSLYAAHRDSQLPSHPPVLVAPLTAATIAPEWHVELALRSTEANEVMLWHGTPLSCVHAITQEGFDERVGALSGRFGAGVYFAEDPAKADLYTGGDDQAEDRYMLLARVSLGTFFEVPDCTAMPQARRAPDSYQSVIGRSDGVYREFVTYDGWLAYPEFLVHYSRVTS